MKPRKLTEEILTRIREVEMIRRSIPTRSQLAQELGVSKSLIDQVAKKLQLVPHGTSTKLQHGRIELDTAKP